MVNFFPNMWQMMLNNVLIPKIPFSFFADFWVRVTSEAPGVSLGRILGSRQLSPFWGRGGSSQGALSTPPHQLKTRLPHLLPDLQLLVADLFLKLSGTIDNCLRLFRSFRPKVCDNTLSALPPTRHPHPEGLTPAGSVVTLIETALTRTPRAPRRKQPSLDPMPLTCRWIAKWIQLHLPQCSADMRVLKRTAYCTARTARQRMQRFSAMYTLLEGRH